MTRRVLYLNDHISTRRPFSILYHLKVGVRYHTRVDRWVCVYCIYMITYPLTPEHLNTIHAHSVVCVWYYDVWVFVYCTADPTWGDIFECCFKSLKLKAQKSLFTETWQKRRSSFEPWAFENVTASGIGCWAVLSFVRLVGVLSRVCEMKESTAQLITHTCVMSRVCVTKESTAQLITHTCVMSRVCMIYMICECVLGVSVVCMICICMYTHMWVFVYCI